MSAYLKAIEGYSDARRHWLIVESEDWDILSPALVEWGDMIPALMQVGGYEAVGGCLRVLVETAYVRGYERGLRVARA